MTETLLIIQAKSNKLNLGIGQIQLKTVHSNGAVLIKFDF